MGFLDSHGLARFKAKIDTLIDGKLAKKKNTQTSVSDPTASGTATEFISGITQNAQGVISPTKASVPTASTSVAGLVRLNNTLTSTSTSQALTAAQGKALNDAITNKADKVTNATSGNFAGLDTNGNLTDSGSKASDFLLQSQGVANAGKIVKVNDSGYLELAAAETGKLSQTITQEISVAAMGESDGVYETVQTVSGVTANTCFSVFGLDMSKLGAKLTIATGVNRVSFSTAAAPLASQTITIELRG